MRLAAWSRYRTTDPTQSFEDHMGRPIPVLDEGKAIEEAF